MSGDLDRLRLEMDTLWGPDADGRSPSQPLVALAVADEGCAARYAPAAPPEWKGWTASDLLAEGGGTVAALGALRGVTCVSYLFPPTLPLLPALPGLALFLSSEDPSPLEPLRPEAWWRPQEWRDLLADRLGPWAIGVAEGRVATLCHTPVASAQAAEAGVWTHPECRGRGYAAVVTAAWAQVARSCYETLFYSADLHNAASQKVAERLGLHPLGHVRQWWAPQEEG